MKKIGFKSVAAVLAALIMLSSLPLGSFAADKKTGAGGDTASVSAAESKALVWRVEGDEKGDNGKIRQAAKGMLRMRREGHGIYPENRKRQPKIQHRRL